LDTSTGKLFDQALDRPKRRKSLLKQKQTKVAEDTVLNQHGGVCCVVNEVKQYATPRRFGTVNDYHAMVTFETHPMKWTVKRLD
jgi:hypothetical protein